MNELTSIASERAFNKGWWAGYENRPLEYIVYKQTAYDWGYMLGIKQRKKEQMLKLLKNK